MGKILKPISHPSMKRYDLNPFKEQFKLSLKRLDKGGKEMAHCGNPVCLCTGDCYRDKEWVNPGFNPPEFSQQLEMILGKGEVKVGESRQYTERELEIVNACEALKEVLLAKNANYGDSFKKYYDKRGATSVEMRLEDKMNRLTALIDGEKDKVGESLADTLLDIAGYGILAYVEENRPGK